ncbi:MAG: gluconate 2-dehydrogenase subunit 3 family protein [Colwellia sp.]|nr:gluconate 2-dehydrogenase subunit 3 family protein [Colwellia sp.]
MSSFFDTNYQTPLWLSEKLTKKNLSRRNMMKGALKSAGGAVVVAAIPISAWSAESANLSKKLTSDPWLTLDSVLNHLLPSSKSGPGAKEIHATTYLFNVVHLQPTEQTEIDFIYKGVGWLNGYSQSQLKKNFSELTTQDKDKLLRGISQSQAGENWLNTLLGYILEATLTPPIYGGNPNQIGWQWLEHQGGFPLPSEGTRFYEIPNQQSMVVANTAKNAEDNKETNIRVVDVLAKRELLIGKGKKA